MQHRSLILTLTLTLTLPLLLIAIAVCAEDAATASSSPTVEMVEVEGPGAQWWPRWRGPSGQGHVDEGSAFPDTWSPTQNVRWKVPVPGRGNSSPVVWGDRIFLTTAYDGGTKRSILCYRRADGQRLWETFAPKATPESAHPKNTRASSTPVTDGERVYAYFGNYGLLAVTMDGETIWHRKLGPFDAYHGTASSPLLYEDKVLIVQDHSGTSFLAAFDKSSGKQLWRTERDARVVRPHRRAPVGAGKVLRFDKSSPTF